MDNEPAFGTVGLPPMNTTQVVTEEAPASNIDMLLETLREQILQVQQEEAVKKQQATALLPDGSLEDHPPPPAPDVTSVSSELSPAEKERQELIAILRTNETELGSINPDLSLAIEEALLDPKTSLQELRELAGISNTALGKNTTGVDPASLADIVEAGPLHDNASPTQESQASHEPSSPTLEHAFALRVKELGIKPLGLAVEDCPDCRLTPPSTPEIAGEMVQSVLQSQSQARTPSLPPLPTFGKKIK